MTRNEAPQLAQVMAAALAGRTGIHEGADWGALVDQHLQAQVLESYREQIGESDPAEALAWLMQRLSAIEARVLTLQAAAMAPQAAADGVPFPHGLNTQAFLPPAATILCDHELSQTGFYPVEYTPEGTPFRWIGPAPRATIVLPRTCLPVEIRIMVSHIYVTDIVEQIKIALAGGEFVPVAVERLPIGAVLSARPQAGPSQGARSLQLDIDVVRTKSPREHGEADGREISVALSRIDMISLR